MAPKKKDSIPSEFVAKYVRDWINRYDGPKWEGAEKLAVRSGLGASYFIKLNDGTFRYQVSFDAADRTFCAMEIPNVWYCDEALQEHYLRVVPEADRMYPLAVAA